MVDAVAGERGVADRRLLPVREGVDGAVAVDRLVQGLDVAGEPGEAVAAALLPEPERLLQLHELVERVAARVLDHGKHGGGHRGAVDGDVGAEEVDGADVVHVGVGEEQGVHRRVVRRVAAEVVDVVAAVDAVQVREKVQLQEIRHAVGLPRVEELREIPVLRAEVLPEVQEDAAVLGRHVDDVAADLPDAAVDRDLGHAAPWWPEVYKAAGGRQGYGTEPVRPGAAPAAGDGRGLRCGGGRAVRVPRLVRGRGRARGAGAGAGRELRDVFLWDEAGGAGGA